MSVDQILGVGQFLLIEVHIALRRRDARVPQQTTGEFDPLLATDFRPAFVVGQVQDQIPRQARQVTQPGIRAAQIRDGLRLLSRRQENRTALTLPDSLRQLLAQLPAGENAPWFPSLERSRVLAQALAVRSIRSSPDAGGTLTLDLKRTARGTSAAKLLIAGRATARYDGPPRSMHSRAGFESEYPFPSKFFDLDGLRYHYLDEGRGETLLCVHGNPTWSFAWRNIIKNLSRDYRVIAIDHIGCGFSDKPQHYEYRLARHIDNLSRFIVGLDLQNITLLAHDWGGAIGMGTAGNLPERFARFVLFNTAAFRSQRTPWRIAVCRWPLVGPLGVRGLNLFARAALTMAVSKHERMTAPVRAGFLAPYDNWNDRVAILRFVQDIPMSPSHPSFGTLVQIEERLALFRRSPVLFVWGMRDWCFTPVFLEEFLTRFPQAEALRLADAGHYVFEDAFEEIVPRLRAFLAGHRVASA